MTFTPMQAPDYGANQGISMSESMQAVYDSILQDEETRQKNAQTQAQLPQALAQFSQSASSLANNLFQKRIDDMKAKGLYDARMAGSISQEQIDAYDAEVDAINADHQTIEKAATSIEKADQHDIIAEQVRSTDPYYQYYYKLGQLRNQVRELPLLHSQLKESLTIDDDLGNPLPYASITKTEDMAAWNATAEMYMMRAFAGVNPVLAAKEIFPTVDEIFTNDANRFAAANAKRHKDERISLEKDKLTAGLISKNQAQLDLAIQNHNLSRADFTDWMLTLAKGNALDNGLYEMLGEARVRDRTTGELVPVSEKFQTEYLALAGVVQQAGISQYNRDAQEESIELVRQVEEEILPSIQADPDRVTVANIDEFIDKIRTNPNAGDAIALLENAKITYAVDYQTPTEIADLVEKGMQQIESGAFGWNDIERMYSNSPKVLRQLKNYMKGLGMTEGQDTLATQATAELQAIEDEVKKAVGISKDTAASGTVGLEVIHQQGLFMRDFKANLASNLSPQDAKNKALKTFYDRFIPLSKTDYVSPDGYPGAIQRLSPNVQVQEKTKQRLATAVQIIPKNPANDRLANYDKIYTPEQFNKATELWRKGEVDPFTSYIASLTNLTPYQVLNEINKKMFNVDLPLPQPVGAIVQQLTPEQVKSLNRFGSPAKVGRYTGQPLSLVSPAAQTLPADYRQRGNEMLNYMTNDLGMSRIHAIGLLVNAERESSLQTTNPGDYMNGVSTSNGLFQWHAGRLTRARKALGGNWDNWKAQIKYALEEPGEPGQEYLNTQFSSPQEAADWWMRYWERTADPQRDSEVHRKYIPSWQ